MLNMHECWRLKKKEKGNQEHQVGEDERTCISWVYDAGG